MARLQRHLQVKVIVFFSGRVSAQARQPAVPSPVSGVIPFLVEPAQVKACLAAGT